MSGPDPLGATVEFFRSGAVLANLKTGHLWFLYYLVYLYTATATVLWALPRVLEESTRECLSQQFRRMAASVWRPLIFAVPTCATLYFMRSGALDTELGFAPVPRVLAAYGVFFGFGWLLHGHSDLLAGFQKHAWKQVLLAVLILPVNGAFVVANIKALPAYNPASHTAAMLTGSVMVWLLIFGLTGLFMRYLNAPSDRIRYVADASYWMYLVHLPFMIYIPIALAPLRFSALLKVAIVLGVSVPILFASYHFLVRFTVIGEVLNGSRHRRENARTEELASAASA
jgi:hypothetical protein